VPGVGGELGEGAAVLHAGVVDQDVDGADLGLDLCHAGVDRVGVGHCEGGSVHGVARRRERSP